MPKLSATESASTHPNTKSPDSMQAQMRTRDAKNEHNKISSTHHSTKSPDSMQAKTRKRYAQIEHNKIRIDPSQHALISLLL